MKFCLFEDDDGGRWNSDRTKPRRDSVEKEVKEETPKSSKNRTLFCCRFKNSSNVFFFLLLLHNFFCEVVVKMTSMRKCLINIDQNRKGKRKRRRRGNVLQPQAAAVTAIALPRVNFLATAQLRVITVQSIHHLFMDKMWLECSV